MRYPPFCDIILIGISGKNVSEVEKISNKVYKYIDMQKVKRNLDIHIFKPVPSPIDKIKNKIRWRIIIKCKLNEKIVSMLNETFEKANKEIAKNDKSKLRIICDINPTNML